MLLKEARPNLRSVSAAGTQDYLPVFSGVLQQLSLDVDLDKPLYCTSAYRTFTAFCAISQTLSTLIPDRKVSARIDHHISGFIETHDALVLETVQVDSSLFFVFIITENGFEYPGIYADLYFLHHLRDVQLCQLTSVFLEHIVKVSNDHLLIRICSTQFVFLLLDLSSYQSNDKWVVVVHQVLCEYVGLACGDFDVRHFENLLLPDSDRNVFLEAVFLRDLDVLRRV